MVSGIKLVKSFNKFYIGFTKLLKVVKTVIKLVKGFNNFALLYGN